MKTIFRWLVRMLIGTATLAALAVVLVWYLASGSLPDYDAEVSVAGISGPVEIVRDRNAVPHITGATDGDVFFGLGYAHAQDRLWQMTMLRRTAQGRLSELFGETTFELDVLLRALGLYAVSQEMVSAQAPATQRAMQAYAAGVNARIAQVREEALGRGSPEFFMFGAEIAPWTPGDSIAVNRIMALQLTDHAAVETLRAELSLVLDPARVSDILPTPPLPDTGAEQQFGRIFPALPLPERPRETERLALSPIHPVGTAGASNAWAVAPERSATGATLMASDPHLGLAAPSIWMLAEMSFPDGTNVIGGTIPGLPGILIGRNDTFGWGLTTAYLDDMDIYIERLDPADPTRYLTPDGYEPLEARDVLIRVGDETRTVTLRRTRHGPVIPGDTWSVDRVTPPGHVAALAWTALDVTDPSMDTLMGLMRARSVNEGREALVPLISPPQNVIMADAEGNIALQVMGRQPHRRPGHAGRGRLPVPGWVADNDWLGYLPFEDNPSVLNPPSGLVLNTNNRTTDAPFPRHMSYSWGDSQRINRARRLLGEREFHTVESFIEAQTDIVSPAARTLLPLIGRDLWYQDNATDSDALASLRATALDRLADWNGEMTEHGPEPLLYAAWTRALQSRLIEDELGGLSARLGRMEPLFLERVFRDVDGASAWCDVATSREQETCARMARLALDDALAELQQTYGPRLEAWRWGEAHSARHEHQILGKIPILNLFSDIVQPTGGGDATLMRGLTRGGAGPDGFNNVHASGLRVIYDFGDPEGSRMVIATGQSGHLLSRFYDDLSVLWRRGDYVPMSLDGDRALAGSLGTTILQPR